MGNKQEKQWKKEYRDIDFLWEPGIVHMVNGDNLMNAVKENGKTEAFNIAKFVRKAHEKYFNEELKISEKSLACEIYWHYYIKEKSIDIEKRFGKNKFTTWLIKHMEVIDCGIKREDNNRLIWDVLSIIF